MHNTTMHVLSARMQNLYLICKITYFNPVGNANKMDGLLLKGDTMGFFLGSDNRPEEAEEDGAYYVSDVETEEDEDE